MPTDPKAEQKSLRVLLITARADHGGGPRHILDLLRAFQPASDSKEIEFHMAAPDQEPYAPQFRELTKSFLEIPPRSFSLSAFFRLRRLLRKARIDVIHSHGRGAGVYSRLLGFVTGVRVLHTFHGIHRDPSLLGRVKLFLDRVFAFFSFTPVFVSENEKREALEFGCVRPGTTGHVIENAVDLSRFTSRTQTPLEDTTRPPKFGAFTRADLAKGPDLLLQLVNHASAEGSWACAGITKEEIATFGKVPAHLTIEGKVREPAQWLQSLDVFVSTARNEGLPLGVLEAMAAGCLCVLSDIPAHKDFEKQGAAVLFNTKDPNSFIDAWTKLKADKPQQSAQLIAAKNLMREKHSLETFREKLTTVYLNRSES